MSVYKQIDQLSESLRHLEMKYPGITKERERLSIREERMLLLIKILSRRCGVDFRLAKLAIGINEES